MNNFPVTLKVQATTANVVRTSDGDFNVSHNAARQIVGKQYDPAKKQWVILPFEDVLCVNNLALNYYKSRLQEKSLLPVDQETAQIAGVSLNKESQ